MLLAELADLPPQRELSSFVADLVRAEVPLLAFTPTRTPLEELFFMLTDARSEEVA